MATFQLSARRLILAGSFAVAVAAAPAIAVLAAPTETNAIAQGCPGGEEADQFTGVCVPHTVPNSGSSPFSTSAGNPDVPMINGIPCTGHNSGECIGLAEEQQASTFTPPPAPVFGSSPTVTN